MSTVIVQARVGVISAVARVAAIGCLHAYRKGSWSPGIRIPFFKKEKTRIFHGQPNAALPRERSDSPAVCPAQVAFSWLDRSAPRVASAAEMAALILNPARHGAREMRPLARAAGFRQYAQVLLAACSLLNRGTRMLLRVWRRRYLEARSLCMSLQDNNSDRHHDPKCACPSAVIRIRGTVASCRFASGRSCLDSVAGSDSIRQQADS